MREWKLLTKQLPVGEIIEHIFNLDRYKRTKDKFCGPELGTRHRTLTDAAISCNSDRTCGGFYDYHGDSKTFVTCKGPIRKFNSRRAVMHTKCT